MKISQMDPIAAISTSEDQNETREGLTRFQEFLKRRQKELDEAKETEPDSHQPRIEQDRERGSVLPFQKIEGKREQKGRYSIQSSSLLLKKRIEAYLQVMGVEEMFAMKGVQLDKKE